ncbi:GNAT family N-acetyltransferase [Desulfobacca acetoxidans]|uniref:GCN5-related N-acetyltransferase n=1 Tax=Desulfobacca acetoxidans (strain ATCC 700848 / DSM 11109 / ASRB2) TaxID=880072 RepID=F2NC67_DESAR|nr:N-acetyltransferase [Desulfobacca acetoxidans]AEB08862.1 GCN5-related N-acetyltransferase [Desulfobacca acetoxidans DSM 11109]
MGYSQEGVRSQIRLAVPEDLPQILAVERLCFDKQWQESEFRPALRDIFFVYEEDQVLGFIIACCCEIAKKGVIMRVAVHPEAQGRGIASQLMQKALNILRERKVTCVELDVEITKTDVKRLYEKFGFKTLKVVNIDSDYENDAFYIMKLRFV